MGLSQLLFFLKILVEVGLRGLCYNLVLPSIGVTAGVFVVEIACSKVRSKSV